MWLRRPASCLRHPHPVGDGLQCHVYHRLPRAKGIHSNSDHCLFQSVPMNTLDESRDVSPATVVLDETTPPTTTAATTSHPKAIATPAYKAGSSLLSASLVSLLLLRVL